MNASSLISLTLTLAPRLLGATYWTVIPNDAENLEGNDAVYYPFVAGDMRYQQVYAAPQFAAMPPGGAYIVGTMFRADCALSSGSTIFSNVVVRLSTSSKDPDQLSAVLGDNVGADVTTVFSTRRFGIGAGGGHCPDPGSFEDGILFTTPFYYDSAIGNLLMDIQVKAESFDNRGGFANDAVNILGDSVSRAYGSSAEATVAEQLDTRGLVTLFEFHPVPSLTNALTTNGVVITWPTRPSTFALQSTETLGPQANWQTYTGPIESNFLVRSVTIPYQALQTAQFFRLVWETGRPIPRLGAPAADPVAKPPSKEP